MRNVLAQVPKGPADMVAAAIRPVFAESDAEHVRSQLDVIGVFPTPPTRAAWPARVLVETHDEWQVSDRRYLSEASMALQPDPQHRRM